MEKFGLGGGGRCRGDAGSGALNRAGVEQLQRTHGSKTVSGRSDAAWEQHSNSSGNVSTEASGSSSSGSSGSCTNSSSGSSSRSGSSSYTDSIVGAPACRQPPYAASPPSERNGLFWLSFSFSCARFEPVLATSDQIRTRETLEKDSASHLQQRLRRRQWKAVLEDVVRIHHLFKTGRAAFKTGRAAFKTGRP